MNLYLKLIVLGFLLWDENHFTQGQSSPGPGPVSTAPHSTISIQNSSIDSPSPRIASNTSNQTQFDDGPSNMQAPISTVPMKVTILADNSTAVHPALTSPTTNTNTILFTGGSVSSGTQAPTHSPTTDRTSPLSGTANKTHLNCNGTENIQVEPQYNNYPEILKLENVPDNLEKETLKCSNDKYNNSGDYQFKLQNFIFNVPLCEPTNIMCRFEVCKDDETFNITLDVPPKSEKYSLMITEERHSFLFKWNNSNGYQCKVETDSVCSEEGGKIITGNKVVTNLEPYTKYNCTSTLLYNNKLIKTETRTLMTKIGAPGEVQNLNGIPDNTTVNVTWNEPNKTNGPLGGYRVNISGKGNVQNFETKNITVLSVLFTKLEPYTEYIISVKAFNNNGTHDLDGIPKTIMTRTKEGIPTEVENMVVKIGLANNEVKVDCKQPKRINAENGVYVLLVDDVKNAENTHCHFLIKDLYYLTTYSFTVFYKNTKYAGPPETKKITTRYNDKALIGFLAFFIIITCLALILVMYKIYKLQKRSSCNFPDDFPLIEQDDEKQLLNIEPIPVDQLLETYKRKNADEGRLFLDEFQSIPRVFSKFPIKEARKPCNQSKNRYIDILPYDVNRVVLSEIHGESGSDYINASYINGFKEPRKYIAAQGPKEETMNDFWRMIWEQKSTIIVMVTRCEEGNRNKCAQYWPSNEEGAEEYGDITVKITEAKFFPDYITRKLHISNRREKSERDITHIQFTVWPDHGVPDDPNLLLKLRRRVNALSNFFSGPIIVHCSAGVGRTGTYISIDAMLEGLEAESRVDVYGYVVQLRRQRCLMVQVESQYIFIHKSLVEYNQFGETEISTSELPHSLNNMKKSDLPSEPSPLNCEFQRLPSYKNWRPQTTGNHQDNKDKNRHSSVVPYEFNRVQVKVNDEPEREQTEDSEMSSDEDSDSEDSVYINASFITGYWGTRSIVAAQAPLKNTTSEFWEMIFQKKIKAIVMLSGSNLENEDDCAPYWKEKTKTYNDLEVDLTDENPCGSYTERSFEIRHTKRKDIRKISQFHYNQWEDVLPKETKRLLEMIAKIRKIVPSKKLEEPSRHDKSVPLVVHCSDGSKRTGTFCALWNLLQSAQVEEVIDVFQTVKHLRRQRSGMVSSFEQYEFLYDTLASTIPAQNGQVKITIHQEDKLDVKNEMNNKTPEEKQAAVTASLTETTPTVPKEDETVSNGPSAAAFTEVSLRIDE
ncbi:receptor-type tyrosine-protein phosphatase C isoform X2 [Phyllobates terribilis]|uniref:receptor-type tyrosine-protein phosphatase C isoform X2 n=1 Tax=Phyllobates terribilis TaxID=111132 RepID=UPI003CCA9419